MDKKLWFKARKYGFGWTPCSWEGWLVVISFVVFEVWNFLRLDGILHSARDILRPFIIQTAVAAILLTVISYWKGGGPDWKWGSKQNG